MRKFKTTVFLLVAFLLIVPAPARAWWGWLDDLSGPGRFRGPQFQFRLVCFGEESEAKRLVDDLKNATVLTRKAVGGTGGSVSLANDAWRQLFAELNATRLTFPVLKGDAVKTASDKMTKRLNNNLPVSDAASSLEEARSQQGKTIAQRLPFDETALDKFLAETNADVGPLIAAVVQGITSIGSTGVVFSACSTDKKRRSSIELATDFWYADGKADGKNGFANGEQIRLTTLMPLFSFRVFKDPRFDFLDAGVGAGVYWFTSKGFQSFSGVVLQPGRFDFHAPTLWSTYQPGDSLGLLRRVLAVPTFRVDLIMFPAGFSADSFAGIGFNRVRIPGELVPSWSLFFNLEPFIRKAPFLKSVSK